MLRGVAGCGRSLCTSASIAWSPPWSSVSVRLSTKHETRAGVRSGAVRLGHAVGLGQSILGFVRRADQRRHGEGASALGWTSGLTSVHLMKFAEHSAGTTRARCTSGVNGSQHICLPREALRGSDLRMSRDRPQASSWLRVHWRGVDQLRPLARVIRQAIQGSRCDALRIARARWEAAGREMESRDAML